MLKLLGKVFSRILSLFWSANKTVRSLAWFLTLGGWAVTLYIESTRKWLLGDWTHLALFVFVMLALLALASVYQIQEEIDKLTLVTFRFIGTSEYEFYPEIAFEDPPITEHNVLIVYAAALVENSSAIPINIRFDPLELLSGTWGEREAYPVKGEIMDSWGNWPPLGVKELIPARDERQLRLSFRIKYKLPEPKLKLRVTMKVVGQKSSTLETRLYPKQSSH